MKSDGSFLIWLIITIKIKKEMEPEVKFPKIKWAQRADFVLITVEQADTENVVIDISELKNTLMFSATANG